MDNINCFKIALSNMVGNYVILRHLTSARGAELNGKRGKVVGHDQLHFPTPPRIHVAIPGEGTLKLKLRNLAEPSSFVDEPSHTRLPNERLIPLIEKLLRESSYEDSDRKDTKARLEWLQARLAEGGSIPAVPCMDLMLPELSRRCSTTSIWGAWRLSARAAVVTTRPTSIALRRAS